MFEMLLSERFLEKGAVFGRDSPAFQLKEHRQRCTPPRCAAVFVEIRVQGGSRAYADYSSLRLCIHPWPQPRLPRDPALDSDQRVQRELRKSHREEGERRSPASSPLFVRFAHEFPSCVPVSHSPVLSHCWWFQGDEQSTLTLH